LRLQIGVDPNTPPFESFSADGTEIVGLDADLIRAIGAKAGFEVDLVNAELSELYSMVTMCRLDAGISAIPITDERAESVGFSAPYFTARQVVVVKKGNIKVTGRESLSGMTIGQPAGTLSALAIGEIPGAVPKPNGSIYASFQDLITGSIDAIIVDKPRALSYVRIKPNNLKTVGTEFGAVQYGIAVCKNRPDLLRQIDEGLKAVQADGTLERLTRKWITDDVR
jgi:polar amino acid transport system substrate-binding protein